MGHWDATLVAPIFDFEFGRQWKQREIDNYNVKSESQQHNHLIIFYYLLADRFCVFCVRFFVQTGL